MSFGRFALVLALVPATASGQMGTTGVVTGRVMDSSGGLLPGVTISLKSPEALGDFTSVTDEHGSYRVANLPPATYDLKAELEGSQSVIRTATVRLGGVSEVDFTLSVGSVTETVTVTAEAPTVDPERAGLSINIKQSVDVGADHREPEVPGRVADGARPGRRGPVDRAAAVD